MCSVVILRRPGHPWPCVIAANRDERPSRPWRPPGRYWADRPEVIAGLDTLAGGSWQGLNDWGVTAAVLNRVGTLGPSEGKRSRGELVLEALDHADAGSAAEALSALNGHAYRAFNLLVADAQHAFWLRNDGTSGRVESHPIGQGVSMVTAHDLDDPGSARIRRHLPRFRAAPPPDPERDDWFAWETLLAARDSEDGDAHGAMCVVTDGDYGTVCSSLIALPAAPERRPIWRFAAGRPGEAPFLPVAQGASVAK
jgi:hypothetical protein